MKRAFLLAGILAGAAAGCGREYPGGDVASPRATSEQRLAIVESKLKAGSTPVRSIALPNPCTLRVGWVGRHETDFPLLRLQVHADTEPATSLFVVLLGTRGSSAPPVPFFSTPAWSDMMVVRSELNQLRAHCAEAEAGGE